MKRPCTFVLAVLRSSCCFERALSLARPRGRRKAMHPQLIVSDNPLCAQLIIAFEKCHEEVGYWGRLTGQCNDQKNELMRCFKMQKKILRKGHLEKARADRQKWQEACKDDD